MLNKIKELNNMRKKKVTQKMINDAHRAWSILSELNYECDSRGVDFRSTALNNFLNSGMSGIVSDLEEQSND